MGRRLTNVSTSPTHLRLKLFGCLRHFLKHLLTDNLKHLLIDLKTNYMAVSNKQKADLKDLNTIFDLLTEWLTDWLYNWLIDWISDWLTNWLTDWLTDWRTYELSYWLADWLADLTDLPNDWSSEKHYSLFCANGQRPYGRRLTNMKTYPTHLHWLTVRYLQNSLVRLRRFDWLRHCLKHSLTEKIKHL